MGEVNPVTYRQYALNISEDDLNVLNTLPYQLISYHVAEDFKF